MTLNKEAEVLRKKWNIFETDKERKRTKINKDKNQISIEEGKQIIKANEN